MAFIIWLVLAAISYLILYAIIKAAINHSDLTNRGGEVITLAKQMERQHEETKRQMQELKQLLEEQNRILQRDNAEANKHE